MSSSRAIKRSLSDFKRHPFLHAMSIATVTSALIIVGGVFICHRNFEALADKAHPQNMATLYLKNTLNPAETARIETAVRALAPVKNVSYRTHTSVMQDLQEFVGASAADPLPGGDVFPDLMEIQLNADLDVGEIAVLKSQLQKIPEVAEVDFSENWLTQYKSLSQLIRIVAWVLATALVFGCGFIIANFMGMRHQSRREEIEIVRLIGASDPFILTPFLWEGLLEGIIGALLALVALLLMKLAFTTLLAVHWTTLLGVRNWTYLSVGQMALLLVLGIAMAVCGSFTVFIRFQERSTS